MRLSFFVLLLPLRLPGTSHDQVPKYQRQFEVRPHLLPRVHACIDDPPSPSGMNNQTTVLRNGIDVPGLSPKPPTPPSAPHVQYGTNFDNLAGPPTDPPPPYPATRPGRRARGNTGRSTRRVLQSSDDSQVDAPDSGGETETTPLIDTRRRRASHSSTIHSVQTLAHAVFTLFEAEVEPNLVATHADHGTSLSLQTTSPDLSSLQRAKRYFRPLTRRPYYAALFHLLVLNLPYELGAWIFLFVGTLVGTTLLIILPLGAVICFFDLLGARALARGEIALQTCFHGPLSVTLPITPLPIFSRMRSPSLENVTSLESVQNHPALIPETSFLRLAYLMFRDPTSYQALFYFLVIKPGVTLLITLAVIILVPPAFVLVVPAPAVLRAVRRVGIWQAEVAIDALGCT